jgi:chorismate dehydratase
MKKYKVTAVSYLNTKPFLYGIFQHSIQHKIDLSLNIPSVCAAKLKSGEVDLALVPVAVIPLLSNPHIISDYCIGAVGAVKTVCIYSQVPIEEVETVYLDFHSKTSVQLTKILFQKYWKQTPTYISTDDVTQTIHLSPEDVLASDNVATEGWYFDHIKGTTAALAIGDKTMGMSEKYKYTYDLAEIWHNWTGLPFVFAAWVSNKKLPDDFIEKFNEALHIGLEHIQELIYILPTQYFHFDLKEYFTENISYNLDEAKKMGLKRFLNEIKEMGELGDGRQVIGDSASTLLPVKA